MANEKLSDAHVRMMREYRAGGWSHKDLSDFFSMSEGRCSELCRGKGRLAAGGPIETVPVRGASMTPRKTEVLNARKVADIREGYRQGMSQREIAEALGVSKSVVGSVLRGETKWG